MSTLENVIVIVLLVGWMGYRQLTWLPIEPGRMLRTPLILAVVGLIDLGRTGVAELSGTDVAVVLVQVVLSLGVGVIMGRIATIRPLAQAGTETSTQAGMEAGGSAHPAEFETRTGWFGIALWAALIVVRVGIDVLAGSIGSHLAASTGVILVMVAANRVARVAVIANRASHSAAMRAGSMMES